MAAPKYAERIAILETKFDALKETVEVGFHDLGEKIDAASLNGQTPRVKNMSARLGNDEDVAILAEVVEEHKERKRFAARFAFARTTAGSAVIYFTTGILVAALNAWVHAQFPAIP